MALTQSQKAAVAAGLRAETDPSVVAALGIRDDVALTAWCNSASAVDAWKASCSKRDLFEAINVAQFDGITQGKRDAWSLMQDNVPIDFRRNKMRNAVTDVWSSLTAAQVASILQALTEKATRAEVYITPNTAGNQKTTSTVTALDRNFVGAVSITEVSEALNV